jgi:hypothetical protein
MQQQFLKKVLSSHKTNSFKRQIITFTKKSGETDTIQERSNSDFDVKSASIQFYSNSHNSQSNRLTKLKFYMESSDMLSYVGLEFQVNQSSGRHRNTGQQRLYEFCYFLPFDLWTSYLARILFLKGCGNLLGISYLYKDLQWAAT